MQPNIRPTLILSASLITLLLIIACSNAGNSVTPDTPGGLSATSAFPSDLSPARHLFGLWRWDLAEGISEPAGGRTVADHLNIADALLMPDYAGALDVKFDIFGPASPFTPPALKITATLNNIFDVTGWNVRGIVIDDSSTINLLDPDGYTAQWDIGPKSPMNPYLNFCLNDSSFPDNWTIEREYSIESPSCKLPSEIWFAVDAGTDGPIQSATEFPVASVNGTLRFLGDQAPIICRILDPQTSVQSVCAGTKKFSGGVLSLQDKGLADGLREWTGILNYTTWLKDGAYPLHFAAVSSLDIPTLAVNMVHVDSGPFATGPADTGCSQKGYDPARTCRSKGAIAMPLTDFFVRPPASSSGLALALENKVVRRIEVDQSIGLQSPGAESPLWTRLIGRSTLSTVPAIGDDGTIFFLEPEQGRLRALRPDGTDRWTYQFPNETHSDLVLTSSPLGGLLITILRKDGRDIALVGIGTDGHLKWQFDLPDGLLGTADVPRLAVGPGGTLYYTTPVGGVMAFDLTGQKKWELKFNATDAGNPVVGDEDQLFFIANNGQKVYCVTSDQSLKWTYYMQADRFARFPSLGYDDDLYITIENAGDYIAYRRLDGETGTMVIAIQAIGLRGYISHGTHLDKAYIQRTNPINQGTCCDDFLVSRAGDDNTINWSLNTPGVTQIGAYPVVTPNNDIYVQGPDGMYVVVM
jgi:hypothetical protein